MMNEYLNLVYKNKKLMTVWLVAGSMIVVLIVAVIIPSWRSYFKLKSEAKVLTSQLNFYKKKYNQLSNLDAVQLKSKIQDGLEVLPTYHNAPLLVGILSSLSQEYQVTLGSLIFTPGQVGSDSAEMVADIKSASVKKKTKGAQKLSLNPLTLKLQVSGPMVNIRAFLMSLNKIKPLTKVERITLYFKAVPKNNQPAVQLYEDNNLSDKVKSQVVANVSVDFLAGNLPKTMPSVDSQVFFVPQEIEDKYQEIIKNYRSFVSPADDNRPPTIDDQRSNPFIY